jgi:hypothetical protein
MESNNDLRKTHKTRFKNCKGRIIGNIKEDITSSEHFVHWCPVKMLWVTRKDLLFLQKTEMQEIDKQIENANMISLESKLSNEA